jgi:hypothetical protein
LLQVTVAFTTVARGTDSQIAEQREVVIRSADEWQRLWSSHSAQPAPAVDFSQFMVAGVFLGTRSTAGHSVEIVSVKQEGTVATIEYREQAPARGLFTAQVLTFPFHLVRIPRQADKIVFRKL